MPAATAWSNRVKAVVLGLGLALAYQASGNWWRIYLDHVPDCGGSRTCIADFLPFYAQTVMIWENPRRLYEIEQQHAYQRRIVPYERVLHSPYPPFTVALFAPLGRLSFSNAFLAMTVLNVFLLSLSLRQITRRLDLSRDQTAWLWLFSISSFGVHATLANAQSSFIVLLCFSSFVLAWKTAGAQGAGIAAGMLCVKPQYLFMPHFLLLLHRNWKQFSIGVLLVFALTAVPFTFLGTKTLTDFLHVASITAARNTWANPVESMHNLKALAAVWLPAHWNPLAWGSISAIVLAAVAWINLQARRRKCRFETLWCVNSLALLLLSPHLFTHDLSLLVIPCGLFLRTRNDTVAIHEGIGLALLAMLPAINHLAPTIVAAALVVLLLLAFVVLRAEFCRSARLTDTIVE